MTTLPAKKNDSCKSIEEYKQKYYPHWCRAQDAKKQVESVGQSLARYLVEKHYRVGFIAKNK